MIIFFVTTLLNFAYGICFAIGFAIGLICFAIGFAIGLVCGSFYYWFFLERVLK
jgi:ABC-type dipeptide/oligopeptide/nickel transport system permease subunit